MEWEKGFAYIAQYECTSVNQHGRRYKGNGAKQVACAKLSTTTGITDDVQTLILLSDHLDVPVRFDFDANPQVAYIEVIGKEVL